MSFNALITSISFSKITNSSFSIFLASRISPRRTGWRQGLEQQVILPAPTPSWRPERRSSTAPGGISGGVELLGDGDGLCGFHAPLRTTTLRYAKQCQRSGVRDDDALKAQLRAARILRH